ncbi:hypothetical protein [Bradyrhizobium sp.]|uniref:hypothetical protein n=1 Tax=Bradyrhizobium sp. TaxID=376 RepID=UPI002733AA7C|nr:hypothetical protein [Bradyrhizobium sp.]MDP3693543.1 hypothetical protein [Bradyrhizobium sp.]
MASVLRRWRRLNKIAKTTPCNGREVPARRIHAALHQGMSEYIVTAPDLIGSAESKRAPERRQLNVLSARLCRTQAARLKPVKKSLLRGLLAFGVALGTAGQDLLGDQA